MNLAPENDDIDENLFMGLSELGVELPMALEADVAGDHDVSGDSDSEFDDDSEDLGSDSG